MGTGQGRQSIQSGLLEREEVNVPQLQTSVIQI
jgi:hypothetical protein